MIQIAEAHAIDKWPIGSKVEPLIKTPKTLNDRIKIGKKLKNLLLTNNWKVEVYTDSMEDKMVTTMAAWPFRYWVIDGDKVALVSKVYNQEFFPQEISNCLHELFQSQEGEERKETNEKVKKKRGGNCVIN